MERFVVLLVALLSAAIAISQALLLTRRALRRYLLRTFTGLPDLENVGSARRRAKVPGTAVICGGSFAGLFAARVCADHFESVKVIEPDAWTFTEEAKLGAPHATRPVVDDNVEYKTLAHKRSRVYQYASTHVVQVLLTRFLRAVFPDFDSRAKSSDVRLAVGDLHLHVGGRPLVIPFEKYSDYCHQVVFTSRRMLETLVRRAVSTSSPTIQFVQGLVTDFRVAPDGRICAVAVRRSDGSVEELQCELVADCTGNTQAGYKCLSRALPGVFPAGLRDEYNPKLNFTTFEFPAPPNFEEQLRTVGLHNHKGQAVDTQESAWFHIHAPDPDLDYRTIFLGRTDRGRIVGGVGGWASEVPVTLEGLRDYVGRVVAAQPVPDYVFNIFDLLEPVKDECTVFPARVTSCSRIYYERAPAVVPRNFVALGDSNMRLNPRSGEGVTKCALGAITLDGVLRDCPDPRSSEFSRTYFNRLAIRAGHLWEGSKWGDYARSTTVPVHGESRDEGAVFRWFMGRLNSVMARDPYTAEVFWTTLQFLAPPTDMAHPWIIAQVLWEEVRTSVLPALRIFPSAPRKA